MVNPVLGSDPSGREFTIGGLMSSIAIGGTIGGLVNAAIASAQKDASLKSVSAAFLKGFALGAFFGGGGYALTAVGFGVVSAGATLGAAEGAFTSLMAGDPLRVIIGKTAFGGLFGGLLGFAGGAALKRIGKSLEPIAKRIAAAAPPANPAQLASTATHTVADWTIRKGGFRLAKVGEYWIKEVDPTQTGLVTYAEQALQAQVKGLQRLGNLAPEYALTNGRLIIRDVGSFAGTWSEFAQIRILGSLKMGTIFNDIMPRNIGSNGQIFDPALHPVHEALLGIMVVLGETTAAMWAWSSEDNGD